MIISLETQAPRFTSSCCGRRERREKSGSPHFVGELWGFLQLVRPSQERQEVGGGFDA
jgi:hypothetical protein